MRFKRFLSLPLFFGVVLFSYAAANAQSTKPAPPPPPKVVITDNLSKPAAPSTTTQQTSTTTRIGNYSVNVTEGVTGQNMENGKYLTITKWDGTKWVTKREWVPNSAPAVKPNP